MLASKFQHDKLAVMAKQHPRGDMVVHRLVRKAIKAQTQRITSNNTHWKLWWLLDHGVSFKAIELALSEGVTGNDTVGSVKCDGS